MFCLFEVIVHCAKLTYFSARFSFQSFVLSMFKSLQVQNGDRQTDLNGIEPKLPVVLFFLAVRAKYHV